MYSGEQQVKAERGSESSDPFLGCQENNKCIDEQILPPKALAPVIPLQSSGLALVKRESETSLVPTSMRDINSNPLSQLYLSRFCLFYLSLFWR